MKVIKMLHTAKIGKEEKTLPNYYLQNEEGKRIMIKPVFKNDYRILDFFSEFVGNEVKDNEK